MKKVNIGLKEETHQLAKIISTLKNVTLADFLREAIEEAVKKESEIVEKIKKGLK